MVKKPKFEGYYLGVYYESPEEHAFLQWAFELFNNGIIKKIERAISLKLSDPFEISYVQRTVLKTKTKLEDKKEKMLNGHIYTPEFTIIWNENSPLYETFSLSLYKLEKSKGRLINHLGTSVIEVKPSFDQNNMTRLFKINQKWVWQKYRIYVNLVHPQELFSSTFTPQDYLKTPTGKDRKITKWKVKTLTEYINES